jgi:hypothetical protein
MIESVGGYDTTAESGVASAIASEMSALIMQAVVVLLTTMYQEA